MEQSPVGCQETAATIRLPWRRGSSEMTKTMTNLYNKNLLLLLAADIVFNFLISSDYLNNYSVLCFAGALPHNLLISMLVYFFTYNKVLIAEMVILIDEN